MKKKKYKLTLNGEKWVLYFSKEGLKKKQWGVADHTRRIIWIHPKAKGKMLLDTILHEIEHAQHRYLDEDFVSELSTERMKALRKLGYRRCHLP